MKHIRNGAGHESDSMKTSHVILYGEAYSQRHQYIPSLRARGFDLALDSVQAEQDSQPWVVPLKPWLQFVPDTLKAWAEGGGELEMRAGSVIVEIPADALSRDAGAPDQLLEDPSWDNLIAAILDSDEDKNATFGGGGVRFLSSWENNSFGHPCTHRDGAQSGFKLLPLADIFSIVPDETRFRGEEWGASIHRMLKRRYSGLALCWFASPGKQFTFKRPDGIFRFSKKAAQHNKLLLKKSNLFSVTRDSSVYVYKGLCDGFFIMVRDELEVECVANVVQQVALRLNNIQVKEPTPSWEVDAMLNVVSLEELALTGPLSANQKISFALIRLEDGSVDDLSRWLFDGSVMQPKLEVLMLVGISYLPPALVARILKNRDRFLALKMVVLKACSCIKEGISVEHMKAAVERACDVPCDSPRLVDLSNLGGKEIPFWRSLAQSYYDDSLVRYYDPRPKSEIKL